MCPSRVVALAVLSFIAGCVPDLKVPPGGRVVCSSNADCPQGLVCNAQLCVESDTADTTAPDLREPPTVPPESKAGTTLLIGLHVSEPLAEAPELSLQLSPPASAPCVADGELHYQCSYLATGEENGGLGGVVAFDVRLLDLANNETKKRFAGALRFDFIAPGLAGASVVPPVASLGAHLQVFFATSEPLSGAAVLHSSVPLDDGSGGTVSTFLLSPQPGTLNYLFEHVVTDVDLEGPLSFTTSLTDIAGNQATALVVGRAQLDVSRPRISNVLTDRTRYSALSPWQQLRLTFDCSERLDLPGASLEVLLDGVTPLGCSPFSATSPSYTCTHVVTASDPEGVRVISIAARDASGNADQSGASVVFDFTPPAVSPLGTTVSYVPASENPLAQALAPVTRATVGTTIRVIAFATEALDPGAMSMVARGPGSSSLTFSLVGRTTSSATFEALVAGGTPDGVYAPVIQWTDVVGNPNAAATFATPAIEVKTSRPSLGVDQAKVVYVRSPLGSAAPEELGGFTWPAGPVFALSPADSLSDAGTLEGTTFTLSNGAIQRVRVWGDALKAAPLGSAGPNRGADGGVTSWPRPRLASLDFFGAWVTGVDEAGNESNPVPLDNAEWVATANAPAFGQSPHRLERSVLVGRALALDPLTVLPAGPEAQSIGSGAVLARAEAAWRQRILSSTKPAARSDIAGAYDAVRDRVMVFGGIVGASGGVLNQDSWSWDGATWVDRTPAGLKPVSRSGHAMTWDAARGRVVLFGGTSGGTRRQDTWEWDGLTWVERTPSTGASPSPRFHHAMAYDSARQRVVLFGGSSSSGDLGDLWEWDGTTWLQRTPSGPAPSARARHGLAYDTVRSRLVLFAGSGRQDTWEFDGTTWVDKTTTGAPPGRYGCMMTFAASRARTVMFGGAQGGGTGLRDVWEWDGSTWVDKTPAGLKPLGRSHGALVFSAGRDRVVLFGGLAASGSNLNDTWEWDGTSWVELTPGVVFVPSPRNTPMIYDSVRDRLVLFGGDTGVYRQDTWEFDGLRWVDKTPSGTKPSARFAHGLVFDPVRGKTVLFGGYDGIGVSPAPYKDDVWEWDGTTWTDRTPASGPRPVARSRPGLAFDSTRNRVVLFAGAYPNQLQNDLWTWDGTTWVDVTPATGSLPPPRAGHAIAYDAPRDRLVVFGGGGQVGALQDVWEWDGSAWQDLTPAAGPRPPVRNSTVGAFDPVSRRTVVLGGFVAAGALGDVWEWDGAQWLDVTPTSSARPGARSGAALAFDTARSRLVVFGGQDPAYRQDLWERDANPARQPAVQFDVNEGTAAIDPSSLLGVRVRAYCGGVFAPFGPAHVGATLFGWAGQWQALGTSGGDVSSPARIDWASATPMEATNYLLSRDGQLAFQCRPSGASGSSGTEASVSLDFIEVRLRYSTR